MRYIEDLEEEKQQLSEIYRNYKQHQVRERAQAIILSMEGFCMDTLAMIFKKDRDTIGRWFDRWEMFKFDGLYDIPRPGRKRILSPEEEIEAIKTVEENPAHLNPALIKIKEKTGKRISKKTLKRCLKRQDFLWKRTRKGIKKTKSTEIPEYKENFDKSRSRSKV